MAENRPTLVNLITNREVRGSGSLPDRVHLETTVGWTHAHPDAARVNSTSFVGSSAARYSVEIHFEHAFPHPADVRPEVEELLALSQPSKDQPPPPCLFVWGTINAPVVIDSVQVAYERFDTKGFPTSARALVQLTTMRDPKRLRSALSGLTGSLSPFKGPVIPVMPTLALPAKLTKHLEKRAKQEVARHVGRIFKDVIKRLRKELESLNGRVADVVRSWKEAR